jgi:hypothetical protein
MKPTPRDSKRLSCTLRLAGLFSKMGRAPGAGEDGSSGKVGFAETALSLETAAAKLSRSSRKRRRSVRAYVLRCRDRV